jgi:hypothetical protein
MITNESINACSKLEGVFADLRVSPESIAECLTRSPVEVQERVFEFAIAYLRYLSAQHKAGAYINGNIEIAVRANQIREGYGINE